METWTIETHKPLLCSSSLILWRDIVKEGSHPSKGRMFLWLDWCSLGETLASFFSPWPQGLASRRVFFLHFPIWPYPTPEWVLGAYFPCVLWSWPICRSLDSYRLFLGLVVFLPIYFSQKLSILLIHLLLISSKCQESKLIFET